MTKRLSKWSRHSSRLVCLLAVCGLMYACKDEFVLDDEKPVWLNSSIYESLEQRGNFRTYLKLLADKDVNTDAVTLVDVLSSTGSKTVFVANDSAWDAFFDANSKLPESNPWHGATSYENLTLAQKKLLIHTSMLNNAIVMENLASSESDGKNSPVRGEYMRRFTDVMVTDSIMHLSSEELPIHYNSYKEINVSTNKYGSEKDYWWRFREKNGGKGIYLVVDSTVPMMIHFTAEHMSRNTFATDGSDGVNDFSLIMGHPRNPSDVHIYDALLLEKDAVCENGYVNVTEKPLCPLPSMAEVIRTNGRTNIFSHILDRYSAPFYCEKITKDYKTLHPEFNDSIFIKRYFSSNNYSVKSNWVKPDKNGEIPRFEPAPEGRYKEYDPYYAASSIAVEDIEITKPSLKFDPGWNGFYDEYDVRHDMAAMFVPSDEQMWHYFTQGNGKRLLKVFYAREGEADAIEWQVPADVDELYRQIDCIPVGVIDRLVNNCMQRTFVGSIPSKWNKLVDDAMDPLFDYDEDNIRKNQLETCLLASNGVVYVMNYTCAPADFRAVTAPAFISNTCKIIKSAIYGAYMNLNYYAYLKAMQSRFTFLLPSDKALEHYYDPASMKSRTPRVIKFRAQKATVPVILEFYNYSCPYNKDVLKEEVGYAAQTDKNRITGKNAAQSPSEVVNRLKDILESHTIVHDETNPLTHKGIGNNEKLPTQEYYGLDTNLPLPEYYISKNGNAIKVTRDPNDENKIIEMKGGFQLENERQGVISDNEGVTTCKITETNETDNGYTLVLDAPLVPTYRSVWSIFTNDDDQREKGKDGFGGVTPYSDFYDLCTADGYENEIVGCGLVDKNLGETQKASALKKFKIFVIDQGLDYNVQFFNNYRYTVFVPTNDAIQDAIAHGLPTWDDIYADYHSHCKPELEENAEGTAWVVKTDEDGIVYSDTLATLEDSLRIAAKITYLTNFVRYHFADNSVFADKPALNANEMVTSSYDKELELFCKIHVDRVRNGDVTDLRVCDDETWKANGNSMNGGGVLTTLATDGTGKDLRNILARDISCSGVVIDQAMNGATINSSSAAVIHSIPGYLNHTALDSYGRHDSTWKDLQSSRRYLKRYAIR